MSSRTVVIPAYPLQWPEGWERTPSYNRKHARYKVSQERAQNELLHSLKLFGAVHGSIVISTNVELRRDGLPYANQRAPDDPGVAVYWSTFRVSSGHSAQACIACDKYRTIGDNIRALGLAVEAFRALERSGASQVYDRAFQAFGALPASAEAERVRPWWEVLGFTEAVIAHLDADIVEARFRKFATERHPDKQGGSTAAMVELNRARSEALERYR